MHNLFRHQMERKGIDLRFDVLRDTANKYIYTDQRRIEQVLLNLVANALKFTIKGFVRIGVSIIDESVRFEVKDTGVGIGEESLPNLFKLFGKL